MEVQRPFERKGLATGRVTMMLILETASILLFLNAGSFFSTTSFRESSPVVGLAAVAALSAWMLWSSRSRGYSRRDLGLTTSVSKRWWLATLALCSCLLALGVASEIQQGVTGPDVRGFALLQLAFFNLTFGPLFEETVFRSYLFRRAGEGLPCAAPWAPSLFTGVAFGLWHLPTPLFVLYLGVDLPAAYTGLAPTVIGAAATGVVLGEIRRRSGSLAPCILIHATANGLNTISHLI